MSGDHLRTGLRAALGARLATLLHPGLLAAAGLLLGQPRPLLIAAGTDVRCALSRSDPAGHNLLDLVRQLGCVYTLQVNVVLQDAHGRGGVVRRPQTGQRIHKQNVFHFLCNQPRLNSSPQVVQLL
ncbi:MAG: hypothetical protein ACK559_40115, partial [bacterium]